MNPLLTDTFSVSQLETACAVCIEKVEAEVVRDALAGGFDTYFEFGELALDAQDALGVEVPETEQKHRPRFKKGFTLFVVGYEENDDTFIPTFWKVTDTPEQGQGTIGDLLASTDHEVSIARRRLVFLRRAIGDLLASMDRNKDE